MKRTTSILLITMFWITACKKDNAPNPAGGGTKTPNSILYNWEYNGSMWVRRGFMLLDLDHAENKDKSFMVVDLKATGIGKFEFELKRGPLPIDSLSSNWPPEVRKVAFGYSNDMTVNAQMRIQSQNTGPRFEYRYDSIHKFQSAIYTYNYLNNPLYAGSMAGKTPQGRTGAWGADASDNAIPRDIIFYFSESAFSNVVSPGNGGIYLTDLIGGVNVESAIWKKTDAVMTFEGAYYTHLYFDFDEWQFFTVEDWCPASYGAACTKGGVQIIKPKSMNELMKWPEGWGKK